MLNEVVLMDQGTHICARDAEPTIEPPVFMKAVPAYPWDAFETSAIATRDDVPVDTKATVWAAFTSTGFKVPTYEDLEALAVKHAKMGIDPSQSVADTGLLLSEHAYENLRRFCRSLTVQRPKTRRKAHA